METTKAAKGAAVLTLPKSRVDLRQSPSYCRWMKLLGWEILALGRNQVFLKKIPFLGSVIKLQRPTEPISLPRLLQIARRHRAFLVKIEPNISNDERTLLVKLQTNHFQPSTWALINTKTQILNLQQPTAKIFGKFKKDCRSEIKKALGFRPVIGKNNFDDFYRLLSQSNRLKNLWTLPKSHYDHLVQSFGKNAFCINASIHQNKVPVAGCLVLVVRKTAYYFLAGSLPEGKQFRATYLAVWEAIREAKKRGCTLWDFEGILDERIPSTRTWKGFTHFKKSFGGLEVVFPGSFTWYRHPILRLFSRFMS